jgi:hypothetical protein
MPSHGGGSMPDPSCFRGAITNYNMLKTHRIGVVAFSSGLLLCYPSEVKHVRFL